jgi:hypothetical protein
LLFVPKIDALKQVNELYHLAKCRNYAGSALAIWQIWQMDIEFFESISNNKSTLD